MSVVVRWLPWEHPDGVALRAAQRSEIGDRYGTDNEPGPKPSAADVTAFAVVYDAVGCAIGCGALRDLGDGAFELKRMYVQPSHRGRRIGRRIIDELEAHARQLGATRMLLETGDLLAEAIRLYERAGYRRIPNFGHYTGVESSICYERILDASTVPSTAQAPA